MDDFEDYENDSFGRNFSVTSRKDEKGETKKKVMFKEDDDPLRDINFSDDDDFGELLNEKPVATLKDPKIAGLFGIKTENHSKLEDVPTAANENKLTEEPKPTEKIQINNSTSKEYNYIEPSTNASIASKPDNPADNKTSKMKSMYNDDDDDILGNLGDKNKTQTKKSDLIAEMFGNSRPKSTSMVDISKKDSNLKPTLSASRSNLEDSLARVQSENVNKPTTISSGFSLSAPKEPRRGRRAPMIQNDPLGLLTASTLQVDETVKIEEKTIQPKENESTTKSVDIEDLPEWLGGPKVSKEQKQEIEKPATSEVSSSLKSTEIIGKSSSSLDAVTIAGIDNVDQSGFASKLLSVEFDQQAAIINMQQQEHELRTATALAQQSDKLNCLLETQRIKLTEQEKQFNMLIARQIERQNLLETQIKSQQDRIDSYIKTLAAQPTTLPMAHVTINREDKLYHKESNDEKTESESLLQQLQIEKLYLENTLESLKENHAKEISILEDSYKKQIAFLEEAMVQMEKRMQDETECLEADYKVKIQKLREEITENEALHKTEKETLKEQNLRFIQDVQDRHKKHLEILQQEYTEVIEKITKTKESERQAVEIMNAEGTNVQSLLNKSHVIVENLDILQKRFEDRDKSFTDLQANHLSIQEKNIEYLKNLLEKQKNEFTEEKQRLMATIQKLEIDTAELIREFQKQNASFRESEEILKSRERALLRDREIFVEQSNWERDRLKGMMDAWAKEEDKQLEWLAQERQALATERGKLQIFNRLKTGVDESSKIELEATIRAAQEAAASANQEKLRWQEKINELENKQSDIQEKENHLILKAKELQEFTQSAIAKREEGLRALKEAQFIEERYKEKFNKLRTQEEDLIQRESKLAAEKLELAKQRLSIHVMESNKPEKDIAYNRNGIGHDEVHSSSANGPSSSQCTTYFKDIVDPHLVLLKWDLDNKFDISSH